MSPTKALRLALSKGFDRMIGLPASVTSLREEVCDLAGLLDRFDNEGLLVLLDGPEGALGAILIDRPLLSALVEMQTLGYVAKNATSDRKPTRTDAAVVEPVINDVLARFAATLKEETEATWPEGYRFGAMLPDVRALGLTIRDEPYVALRAEIDLFLGTRQGSMLVALPKTAPKNPGTDPPPRDPEWDERVAKAVGATETELLAVLHCLSIPLSDVTNLAPGDLLELPADAIENVALYSGEERVIAHIRLGQANGNRAIRLGPVPGARPPQPLDAALKQDGRVALGHDLGPAPQSEPRDITPAPATAPVAPEPMAPETANDFDFELPEPDPFDLDSIGTEGGTSAPAAASVQGGPDQLQMAVVPISMDDL